jgi:hypothetical protein
MNKAILTILFIALAFQVFTKNPPGTEKIVINGEVFYLDKQELTYLDYEEYLFYKIKKENISNEEYEKLLPDSVIMERNCVNCFENLKKQTGIHPSYEKFPVIGISKEQAEAYCEWRSKMVNEITTFKDSKEKVEYKLLTEEQVVFFNNTKKFKDKKLEYMTFPNNGFRCIATIQ